MRLSTITLEISDAELVGDFQALTGRGARALLDGSPVHIGNRTLFA